MHETQGLLCFGARCWISSLFCAMNISGKLYTLKKLVFIHDGEDGDSHSGEQGAKYLTGSIFGIVFYKICILWRTGSTVCPDKRMTLVKSIYMLGCSWIAGGPWVNAYDVLCWIQYCTHIVAKNYENITSFQNIQFSSGWHVHRAEYINMQIIHFLGSKDRTNMLSSVGL